MLLLGKKARGKSPERKLKTQGHLNGSELTFFSCMPSRMFSGMPISSSTRLPKTVPGALKLYRVFGSLEENIIQFTSGTFSSLIVVYETALVKVAATTTAKKRRETKVKIDFIFDLFYFILLTVNFQNDRIIARKTLLAMRDKLNASCVPSGLFEAINMCFTTGGFPLFDACVKNESLIPERMKFLIKIMKRTKLSKGEKKSQVQEFYH